MSAVLREHAEQQFAEELHELARADSRPRPPNWQLSPWAVAKYILGGKLDNGFEVTPKYIGNPRTIEIAIATLATDRALLLVGRAGDGEDVGFRTSRSGRSPEIRRSWSRARQGRLKRRFAMVGTMRACWLKDRQ